MKLTRLSQGLCGPGHPNQLWISLALGHQSFLAVYGVYLPVCLQQL